MPIYMKFEGIAGTAGGKRKDWIELQSCQLGIGRNSTGRTGIGASRESNAPSVSEIVITKFQDNSSTHLFRESLQGTGRKVTLEFVNNDGVVYMQIELESTLISSYSISGQGGSQSKPIESLSLNFTKITYTVTAADSKSSKDKASWNLTTP